MSFAYKTIESPVGKLKLVASSKGLAAVLWENDAPGRVPLDELIETESHSVLIEIERQLGEYFAGKRTSFSRYERNVILTKCVGRSARHTVRRDENLPRAGQPAK